MSTPVNNTDRATLWEVVKIQGFHEDFWFELEVRIFDGDCPAMCKHGCMVEPDGHCEHGNESMALFLNLI